jgi:phosphate transport system substrate-binding protein
MGTGIRFRRGVGAVTVALVAVLPVILAVGASPAGAYPQMTSTGSSFAAVAIDEWTGQVATLYGLPINFQVSNSVTGLNNFAQDQVDFGASDIPYSAKQAAFSPNQPYQYMPDVAGALAFMYNLTGKTGSQVRSLILNGQAVEDIFTGRIVYWDDPVIARLNPQLTGDLPHVRITFDYRSDPSGENYLLSDYLLHLDPGGFTAYQSAFARAFGSSTPPGHPSAVWPAWDYTVSQNLPQGYPNWTPAGYGQGQSGADAAANSVSSPNPPDSITYVETAYAKEHNMPVASLVNASGHAVQPTSNNDAVALEKAILYSDLTQNLANVYTNPLPSAYPISAYSYFVAPCSPSLGRAQGHFCDGPQGGSPFPAGKGSALGQFVQFVGCAGQANMAYLGYSPLPPNLVQEDFDAIGRLNGGHQPPPPTAQNCKNPYIDGQLALPGEPPVLNVAAPGTTNTTIASAATATGGAGSASGGAAGGAGGKSTAGNGFSGTAKNTVGGGSAKRFKHADLLAGLTGAALRTFSAADGIALWVALLAAVVAGPPLIAWQRGRRRRSSGGPDGGPGPAGDGESPLPDRDGVMVS